MQHQHVLICTCKRSLQTHYKVLIAYYTSFSFLCVIYLRYLKRVSISRPVSIVANDSSLLFDLFMKSKNLVTGVRKVRVLFLQTLGISKASFHQYCWCMLLFHSFVLAFYWWNKFVSFYLYFIYLKPSKDYQVSNYVFYISFYHHCKLAEEEFIASES